MAAPIKVKHHGNIRWRIIEKDPERPGKFKARFFETQEAANSYHLGGEAGSMAQWMALTEGERCRVLGALRSAGGIPELEQGAAWRAKQRTGIEKPLWPAVQELVEIKRRAGLSESYIVNFEVGLRHLERAYPGRNVGSFTSTELQKMVDREGWADDTRQTWFNRLSTFFGWATKQKYCLENPVLGVEKVDPVKNDIKIYTIAQINLLLATALRVDSSTIHYFAYGLFTGMRPSEIERLTPENIREDCVQVSARNAKNRARRVIEEFAPNLVEWLKINGEIPVANWRVRRKFIVATAGLEWINDGLRHCFCSYGYPIYGESKVAAMSDHSPSILYRNYRALVRKADAEAYWKITPASVQQWCATQQAQGKLPNHLISNPNSATNNHEAEQPQIQSNQVQPA